MNGARRGRISLVDELAPAIRRLGVESRRLLRYFAAVAGPCLAYESGTPALGLLAQKQVRRRDGFSVEDDRGDPGQGGDIGKRVTVDD